MKMKGNRTHFAVVDLETTGGMPRRDRIIEVGIVRTDGEQIYDKYSTLIDPGCTIPREITRITGITTDMVLGKPKFYEVAKDIVEWTEDCIFVAHNVRFDYGFLQNAYRELGYTFSRKLLCTARLSRSLFPHFRSHALGRLIQEFDIEVSSRHRAEDDALATAQLLVHWISEHEAVNKVYDFINLGVKEARLPAGITMARLQELPDQTGVYYFYDRHGELIYIGKAKDIRKRVMQHFAPQTTKAQRMQDFVADIRFELTGSELSALLRESAEIKRMKPRFNKAQRNEAFPAGLFLDKESEDGVWRIRRISRKAPDKVTCSALNFYPSGIAAMRVLEERLKEFGLCASVNSGEVKGHFCRDAQMGICAGFCGGSESVASYNERVELAAETISRLFTRDFIFGEEGRDREELYLVAVEDGWVTHAGYIGKGLIDDGRFSRLKEQLPAWKATIDDNRILWNYLKRVKRPMIRYADGGR
jgi:DNA polymerase III subunit epsilon